MAKETTIEKKQSIVFMGTPEFAVEILKSLHENEIEIKAVITAPDKPAGRGRKINQSAVKIYAEENNLNIMQPSNLKDEEFLSDLKELKADLFVVVAFRMLPEVVWTMPPKGTINLHASLLPNYRGAAPINWAIINGEIKTGVTTFFIEKDIDTGKIIDQESIDIGSDENVGSLYTRLMVLGSDVMLRTVNNIFNNKVNAIEQGTFTESAMNPAPKIFKQDCRVNFDRSVSDTHNFCRGLSPYPAAWVKLTDNDGESSKTMKLFRTKPTSIRVKDNKNILKGENGLLFPCLDFYLEVVEIQIEGKRRMHYKDFLAGNSIENLKIIEN
jgi:methionyl-tRNA formyltransferase